MTDHLESRVSVLEVKMLNVQDSINESSTTINSYGRRFDDYVKDDIKASAYVNQAITKVSNTVESLTTEISRTNNHIQDFMVKMEDTHDTVKEWKVAWSLIIRLCGIAGVLIGAGWTIFKFVHGG